MAIPVEEPPAARLSGWSRVNWLEVGGCLTEMIVDLDHQAAFPGNGGVLHDVAVLLSAASLGCAVSMRSVNRLGFSVCVAWPPAGVLAKSGRERLLGTYLHADGAVALSLMARKVADEIGGLPVRPLDGLELPARRRLALAMAVVLGFATCRGIDGQYVAVELAIAPAPGWGLEESERRRLNAHTPRGWAEIWTAGLIARCGLAVGRGDGGSGDTRGQYEAASVSAAVFEATRAWIREAASADNANLMAELGDIVALVERGAGK